MQPHMPVPQQPTPSDVIFSVMRVRGVHDAAVRRIINDHCRRGYVKEMVGATSRLLVLQGLADRRIPPPVAKESQELLERATESIQQIVGEYTSLGGVLIARRHTTPVALLEAMVRVWVEHRPEPIDRFGLRLPTPEESERNARVSVAAQALHEYMRRWYQEDHHAFHVPKDDIEQVCVAAVQIVEAVYNDPDKFLADRAKRKVP